MAWGEERRNKVIGASLAMGMMVTLLWHGTPEPASSLLSDLTVTAGRPGSAASKDVSGSTRLHHVHMLQAAGDRLHVLAERGESLLTLVTDELEEACSDEDNWAQFCKNRAEDEDYAEKWEPFCSKKLAPTPECDQEKQSQHELKMIHEELIKSCHDVILNYLSVYGPIPGTCNASAPQSLRAKSPFASNSLPLSTNTPRQPHPLPPPCPQGQPRVIATRSKAWPSGCSVSKGREARQHFRQTPSTSAWQSCGYGLGAFSTSDKLKGKATLSAAQASSSACA